MKLQRFTRGRDQREKNHSFTVYVRLVSRLEEKKMTFLRNILRNKIKCTKLKKLYSMYIFRYYQSNFREA